MSLGPLLQRTRTHFLPHLSKSRHALLLGDGDGRFAEALLRANPDLQAEAVDASPAMLAALHRRTRGRRVTTVRADLRRYEPATRPDLVTTHFVLDCLTQEETDALIGRLAPVLVPGGLWVVSEFRIPGGRLRLAARAYVRALYLAFRVLTGLRVSRLPDHETPMLRAGLRLTSERERLFGLLVSQLWEKPSTD